MNCPVCRSSIFTQLYSIKQVPVFLNRRWTSRAAARAAEIGALSTEKCTKCGFVWNSAFEPDRVIYDQAYENDQTHSAAFQKHLAEVADRTIAAAESRPFHLLEVGCGQGVFLAELANRAGDLLLSATGYDPTYRGERKMPSNVTIAEKYFNRDTAPLMTVRPNIVVTRHTIEHVPDPVHFLSSIRDAINGDATLLIETPDVEWIVSRGEFQDLFYEHCSLFTADSLALAMGRAGWNPSRINRVFGDQYLLATGTTSHVATDLSHALNKAAESKKLDPHNFLSHWKQVIHSANQPIALWGAGAKGVTFAMLVDPGADAIKAVVDINPEKQGHYLPKTGIPIISPSAAIDLGIQTVLVMNPNYLEEITRKLKSLGSSATVIPVIGGDDH